MIFHPKMKIAIISKNNEIIDFFKLYKKGMPHIEEWSCTILIRKNPH